MSGSECRSRAVAKRRHYHRPLVVFCKECQRRRRVDRTSGQCPQCSSDASSYSGSSPASSDSSVTLVSEEQLTLLYDIDKRSVDRRQLLATFLASYFPSNGEPEVYIARHMSPILVLPDLDLSSPMMSSAVDTLCLAHLGSSQQDQRLLRESQNAYGRVLHSIMQAVSGKGSRAVSPREVIASCLLMSVYDDGIPGRFRSQNYSTHLFGAAQYAQAIGPSCLDVTEQFDQKLLMWLRFQSLFVCTARRKSYFWARPEWRATENKFSAGGSRSWYPLLVPLPGLLERADRFLHNPNAGPIQLDGVYKVCKELDDFRAEQFHWTDNDYAGWPGVAAITDLDAFDMEIEEHCFITTSTTFTTFHVFLQPGHAMRCSVSWFLSLVSDCTLLRLLAMYPDAEKYIGCTAKEVEQKAYISATEVCRCVYYYSNLNSMAYANLLLVWIDLAQTFFEEYGAIKQVGWCQACLIATKLRMERVKTTQRASLCRIGDLFGAFTKACRYRTMPIVSGKDMKVV